MSRKYDWDLIKEEYVSGDMSDDEIVKKYGVAKTTLQKHIKDGDWLSLKKDGENTSCSNDMSKELGIADKLLDVLDGAVNDEKQFYRYIVKEKNGPDSGEEERIFGKMDMQAFNNAIKALDSLQEIKRGMQGILSPAEEKRLQLENLRSKADEKDSGETGVVILPEVEDEK